MEKVLNDKQEEVTSRLNDALVNYLTEMGFEAEFAIEGVWEFIEGMEVE